MADEEQPTLGQMLRARREARGLSQEQAGQQARVQLVFVRALEEDDYHLLPDALYLTRFVYEYASSLGLDPAAAGAAFRRQVRRPGGSNPLYRAVPRVAALPWRRILWTAAAILPLIPLTFILLSLAGKERDAAPTAPPGEAPGPAVPPGPAGPAAIPPSGLSVPSPSPGAPASEPSALPGRREEPRAPGRHLLVARAREITWLAVEVDGEPEHEVLLREGEMVRWGAERGFVVTVGNPGGVELLLDGEPVRLPGRRGEVVRGLRLPPPPGGAPAGSPPAPDRRAERSPKPRPSPSSGLRTNQKTPRSLPGSP